MQAHLSAAVASQHPVLLQLREGARYGLDGQAEVVGDVAAGHRQREGAGGAEAVIDFQQEGGDPLLGRAPSEQERQVLGVSQVAAGRKNCIRVEIYGSRKSAWWNSEAPEMLHYGNRDEQNQTAVRNTPSFGPDAAPFLDYPAGHVEGFPDTFKMLFRSVYSAIGGGAEEERLFASAEDGHAEVAVCEAVMKSHKAKAWVKV